MRHALILLTAIVACTATATFADPGADAKRDAQVLASQAVQCLKHGEDLDDPAAKRAAYEQGLALAQRAVVLDDANSDAHFGVFGNKGRILLLDGTVPNPVSLLSVNRDLERALELNPNHSDALAAKGGLYRQLPWALGGSLSLAETCLTKAITIDPEAVGARIELAATYLDKGEPERSRPLLETAAELAQRKGKQRELHEARALLQQMPTP
jgi:tetratricopeptide (TPR) repeat protein